MKGRRAFTAALIVFVYTVTALGVAIVLAKPVGR